MSIATELPDDDSEELARLRHRIVELESALRPFAEAGRHMPHEWCDTWRTWGLVPIMRWWKAAEVMK